MGLDQQPFELDVFRLELRQALCRRDLHADKLGSSFVEHRIAGTAVAAQLLDEMPGSARRRKVMICPTLNLHFFVFVNLLAVDGHNS